MKPALQKTFSARRFASFSLLACALASGANLAQAQQTPSTAMTELRNVLELSAQGSAQARQDWLLLTLSATEEGSNAAQVQERLRQTLEATLAEVKKTAQERQMEVSTGHFSVMPRYDNSQKIKGWQGRASVQLQGLDFPRITAAAARASAMRISDVQLSLSREQRAQAEAQAQAQAIEAFKARAAAIAQAFGFANYSLRQVSISSDGLDMVFPRARAIEAVVLKSAPFGGDKSLSLEPGMTEVNVNVSGTVQAQ